MTNNPRNVLTPFLIKIFRERYDDIIDAGSREMDGELVWINSILSGLHDIKHLERFSNKGDIDYIYERAKKGAEHIPNEAKIIFMKQLQILINSGWRGFEKFIPYFRVKKGEGKGGEKKEEKEGKVYEYIPIKGEGYPEHKFDVGRCVNSTDLTEFAPLTMNRDLIMVAIIKPNGKLASSIECYPMQEWIKYVLMPENKVYVWIPEHNGANKDFPVHKLSYSGIWINYKASIFSICNTYVLFNAKKTPIGSSFGVSSLHGAIEDVYDIRPTNRNNLYDFKDDSEYWKNFADMPYYPLPNDLISFFQIQNYLFRKFDSSSYMGELARYKNEILRHGTGFEVGWNGQISICMWKNNLPVNGIFVNKDFTRIFSGEYKKDKNVKEGIYKGTYYTPRYMYDGEFIFSDPDSTKFTLINGLRSERLTGIRIGGTWKDEHILLNGGYNHFYKEKIITKPTMFFNLDLGNPDNVLELDDGVIPISEFPKFKNAITVVIRGYDGDLSILSNLNRLQEVRIDTKIDDISPLKGKPINIIYMDDFSGNIGPLKGAPIKEINMRKFNGSLRALKGAPIEIIYMNGYTGELHNLKGAPIEYIHMNSFNKDLSPLKGAPIKSISMNKFNGDLSPLRGAPIHRIKMDSFNGDLSPLKGTPIEELSMNSFSGDLSPLKGAPIKEIMVGGSHFGLLNDAILYLEYIKSKKPYIGML